MKIELCEDNGFLNNGKPSLVVLVVTMDDGKQRRFPYAAKNTIQQLYVDVRNVINVPGAVPLSELKSMEYLSSPLFESKPVRNGRIEREDVVKCVKVFDRDEGLESDMIPKIGKEYRILNIIKKDGNTTIYEVLDDEADNKIRIPVFPSEVELSRKFVPPPPRKMVYSITKQCNCGEVNAIDVSPDGNKYSGLCIKCGEALEEVRILNKAA